jgi:cardiolipin synthase
VSAERIWVTEAYLAGPRRLYQVFEDAARDQVDVRLLVPGASDIPLVRNLSRTGYRRLLRAGVRIWEWGGPMLHAKTISLDRRWIRVGSSNLNPSSLVANWELDLFVEDHRLAQELDRRFATDLTTSGEVVTRVRRLLPAFPGLGNPTALVVAGPEVEQSHHPSLRERRHRAFVRATVIGRAARAALLGTAAISLALGAALLVLFPRVAAYASAALFMLVSALLTVQAIRQRRLD